MKSEKKVPVMVLVPSRTAKFLDGAAVEIQTRYAVRSGKACLLRAFADALAASQFSIAAAGPTNFHLTEALTEALRAYSTAPEVRTNG
jgi:hypothetical protein